MSTLTYEVSLEGLPARYTARYNALMTRLGREVIERIRERTLKGFDANGKPFGEYARGGGRIDLHDTGRMLDSLRVASVSPNGFVLGVGTDYAKYVDKRFGFFALSKADMDYIATRVEEDFFDFLVDPKRQQSKARKREV